jgi:serine/threonine protein kinase
MAKQIGAVAAKSPAAVSKSSDQKQNSIVSLQHKIYGKDLFETFKGLPLRDIPLPVIEPFHDAKAIFKKEAADQKVGDPRLIDAIKWKDRDAWHIRIGKAEFQLRSYIAQGSFSTVHSAVEITEGGASSKLYALKLAKKPHKAENWQAFYPRSFYKRLERESLLIGSEAFNHPNIIRPIAAGFCKAEGTNNWQGFTLSEFISGGDLFNVFRAQWPLLSLRLSWAEQIISAVQHLHQHKIVHRDLKPENFLVRKDGSLGLTDFELSRTGVKLKTQSGSYHYIAPEVTCCESYDGAAADAWSVGAIFHVIFTGSHAYGPFDIPMRIDSKATWDARTLRDQVAFDMGVVPLSQQVPDNVQAASEAVVEAVSSLLLIREPEKRSLIKASAALKKLRDALTAHSHPSGSGAK